MVLILGERAVEMTRIELRYGRDPDLHRLAEAIIAVHEEDIAMLRNWLLTHIGT